MITALTKPCAFEFGERVGTVRNKVWHVGHHLPEPLQNGDLRLQRISLVVTWDATMVERRRSLKISCTQLEYNGVTARSIDLRFTSFSSAPDVNPRSLRLEYVEESANRIHEGAPASAIDGYSW